MMTNSLLKLRELTHTYWSSSSQKEIKAPNVLAFAKRFNDVSNWVATEILIAPSQNIRVEILEKFILVEKELLKMENFNGLMEIHAGLNFLEISRLKPIWKVCIFILCI